MDGLLVYRQYLENIRGSINNYSLSELESKEFMGIIRRVGQIADLSYIDVILQNAGVNISFIGDKKFLNEKVILKSKLDKYFEDTPFVKDKAMKDALSEYMSMFIIEEDDIIESIEEITGEDGIPEISLDYFPQSSAKYYSAQEILEKNKETLTALFGGVEEMNKKLNQESENSSQFVEEYFDEETEDEELHLEGSDIRDLIVDEVKEQEKYKLENEDIDLKQNDVKDSALIEGSAFGIEKEELKVKPQSDFIESEEDDINIVTDYESKDSSYFIKPKKQSSLEIEKKQDVEEEKHIVEESVNSPISKNQKIDISFLSDDVEEDVISSHESLEKEDDLDDYETEVSKKDFNKFLDEEDKDFDDDFDDDFEDDDFIDNTGKVLSKELEDEDDKLLRDTDPIERNMFEETANYFLTGKSEVYGKDDLRNLYKSREKIIDSEDVSSTDDAVAKMVLAMTDGLLNLPRVTGRLFKKAKSNGRKMRENMIVEDEEDDG